MFDPSGPYTGLFVFHLVNLVLEPDTWLYACVNTYFEQSFVPSPLQPGQLEYDTPTEVVTGYMSSPST